MPFETNELKYHKIDQVRTLKIRNRFSRLHGKNSQKSEHAYGSEFIIKELITDKGAQGWGLFAENPSNTGKELDDYLIGKSIAQLFDPQVGVIDEQALPFDFALHDLAGIVLGMPVYRMIGSDGTNPIPCYDGAILMDDISPDSRPGGLKAILDECRDDYRLGYRAFKLKMGRGSKWMPLKEGIKRDIEVTRLVREYFPDCDIMVDANDAYNPQTIVEYLDGVYDCNLFWIEEPFRENREDLMKLREYLAAKSPTTLIADGESRPDTDQLLSLCNEGLLDVLQMDIRSYGFTAWRKIMPRVMASSAVISPHNWGLKIKTHYTAAFGAAYPKMLSIEGVLDETEGIDISHYELDNGSIFVPDRPGFGMDLIWGKPL